jgi:MFS transporter, OPA family, glycerol-3-phosphate transporter
MRSKSFGDCLSAAARLYLPALERLAASAVASPVTTMSQPASTTPAAIEYAVAQPHKHPPGYRLRRGQNWLFLGLTYASYYLCRYNLGIVAPEFKSAMGFSNTQYGAIDAGRNWAYAIGQFVNGLFTDRLGGKQAMTIGALGTVVLNLLFGLTAWSHFAWLFAALFVIRMFDGYMQAFGAPGMVKINTAWFRRQERGAFAGIFGFMINLGQTGVGQLASMLATGFSIPLIFFAITVPKLDWRYMFIVPPAVVAIIVVLMYLMVKNHPEESGFRVIHDDEDPNDDPHARIHLAEVFRKITSNPIVWIVAGAYFCTGFVRTAIISWYAIYLHEAWGITKDAYGARLFWWFTTILLPFLASFASLGSGLISDRMFGGRRAPVAALLYFGQSAFTVLAIVMCLGFLPKTLGISVTFILGIHVCCNATHSILGTAAAMDLGGRKMAGFAAGVIDSFQYIGAGLAGLGLGWFLDQFAITPPAATTVPAIMPSAVLKLMSPTVWFASMLPFGIIGTVLMGYLWLKHRGTDTRGT